jgi:hypothetical protein
MGGTTAMQEAGGGVALHTSSGDAQVNSTGLQAPMPSQTSLVPVAGSMHDDPRPQDVPIALGTQPAPLAWQAAVAQAFPAGQRVAQQIPADPVALPLTHFPLVQSTPLFALLAVLQACPLALGFTHCVFAQT